MSKGEGKKIVIKFTEDLVGDVSGNELAFSVTGKEYQYVNGNLISGDYRIMSVTRAGTISDGEIIVPNTVTASTEYSTAYKATNVTDGSNASHWLSADKYGTQWLCLDLGEVKDISKLKIMIIAQYSPSIFDLQVSNNNSTWATIMTGLVLDTPLNMKEFNIGTVSTRYIRLLMKSSPANYYLITEVQILGPDVIMPTDYMAVQLLMNQLNRFNNVEGDLTVKYDATKGNLSGRGGRVESFETDFTPVDLVPTPNPGIEETIKANPYEITLNFEEIEYRKGYAEETIKANPYEIVLDLKHISEINP